MSAVVCARALTAIACTATAAVGLVTLGAGSATAAVPHNPVGRVERVVVGPTGPYSYAGVRISGWAADPDIPRRSVKVTMTVDHHGVAYARTHLFRPGIAASKHVGRHTGWVVSARLRSGKHLVCAYVTNRWAGSNTSLGCRRVTIAASKNQRIVTEAARHLGQRYVEGAAGPYAFDCSGLVRYAYNKQGLHPPRIAQQQYRAAHRVRASRAAPGDLVFYHDGSGYTYHVAIFTGGRMTIVAANSRQGVIRERIWDPNVTYGSFTH